MEDFEEIKQCLTQVANPATADKEGLVKALKRLDEIAKEKKGELPKDLHHYLQRRSYEKALNFLQ